jgi:hypothetical protein
LELSGEHTPRRRDPLGAFAEATMDRIVLKTAKIHKYQNGGFEIGGGRNRSKVIFCIEAMSE